MSNKIKVFLIAGEVSGDVLGGKLINKIKEEISCNSKFKDRKLEFKGVGGKNMIKSGLKSIFDMSELSLMGFVEIIPHIPKLLKRINQTVFEIIKFKPDIVITIDAPDFSFRVIKKLNKNIIANKIKKIHYVAPTVWAYREKRAKKIAQLYNLLLVILPFEPPYFTKYGLKTIFIGHPITENKISLQNNSFRKRHKIEKDQTLICLTPGSRAAEIKIILPQMIGAINILKQKHPNLIVAIPALTKVRNLIQERLHNFEVRAILVPEKEKLELFDSANVALAKSGTNTIEMAMYNLPMIVTYKANFITYILLKMMIKIKFANLINLILNKEVIPEMLQYDCEAKKLANKLELLLNNSNYRKNQIEESQIALKMMGMDSKTSPSEKAAKEVLNNL